MRPSFFRRPPRMMSEVQMHIWGEMILKRGMPNFPTGTSRQALHLLSSEEDHFFMMASCPYKRMDWQGCLNILFIEDETPDDRGKI
jgi:hypothetical protein